MGRLMLRDHFSHTKRLGGWAQLLNDLDSLKIGLYVALHHLRG